MVFGQEVPDSECEFFGGLLRITQFPLQNQFWDTFSVRSTIQGGSGISTTSPQRLSADDPSYSFGTAGNKTPTPGREHRA